MASYSLTQNVASAAIALSAGQSLAVQNLGSSDATIAVQGSHDGTNYSDVGWLTLSKTTASALGTVDMKGCLYAKLTLTSPTSVSVDAYPFDSRASSSAGAGALVVIDGSGATLDQSATGRTGGTYETYRRQHKNMTGKALKGVVLVFGNFYKSSNTEADYLSQIVVKASVQRYVNSDVTDQTGPRRRAYFNGLKTVTIDPGMLVYSQYIPFDLGVGETFFTYTAVTPQGSNTVRPASYNEATGTTASGGRNTGDGRNNGTDVTESGTVTIQDTNQTYTPLAVLGVVADGSRVPCVALCGDSLVQGFNDAGFARDFGAWAVRGFGGYTGLLGQTAATYSVPFVNTGYGSETAAQFAIDTNQYNRQGVAAYCTHELHEYGTNDLGTALATTKKNILNAACRAMVAGRRVIRTTLLPRATSTDGYKTGGNQSTIANESTRVSINQWIRDTSASGFVAQATAQAQARNPLAAGCVVLDICAPVECNSSGVLTADAGFILPYTGAVDFTGTAQAGTTTSAVKVTTGTTTLDQYRGYVVRRVANNEIRCIWYHTADSAGVTTFNLRDAFSTMSSGDSIEVYQCPISDGTGGIHYSSYGHKIIGDYVNALVPVLTGFF